MLKSKPTAFYIGIIALTLLFFAPELISILGGGHSNIATTAVRNTPSTPYSGNSFAESSDINTTAIPTEDTENFMPAVDDIFIHGTSQNENIRTTETDNRSNLLRLPTFGGELIELWADIELNAVLARSVGLPIPDDSPMLKTAVTENINLSPYILRANFINAESPAEEAAAAFIRQFDPNGVLGKNQGQAVRPRSLRTSVWIEHLDGSDWNSDENAATIILALRNPLTGDHVIAMHGVSREASVVRIVDSGELFTRENETVNNLIPNVANEAQPENLLRIATSNGGYVDIWPDFELTRIAASVTGLTLPEGIDPALADAVTGNGIFYVSILQANFIYAENWIDEADAWFRSQFDPNQALGRNAQNQTRRPAILRTSIWIRHLDGSEWNPNAATIVLSLDSPSHGDHVIAVHGVSKDISVVRIVDTD
ncbi:MAG: hypothetical protein FWG87_08680 [Defluviitaleaceae bacterium]|nr:hypothetical protein [Defluviitaleaceae bacterium]